MNLFLLQNKTCIVTGAGRGIGYCIASNLSAVGAIVTGVDKEFDDDIEFNFKQKKVNLESEKEIENFCKLFKKLDILINCAGITIQSAENYQLNDWQKTLNVNLTAPFLMIKNLKDALSRSRSASIINISSLNGKLAFPDNPAYIASKTGLDGLTRSYALDYGSLGVRVNSIAPGYIKTKMTGDSWNNFEKREKRKNRTMLGRWGKPQDLVGPVLFLASDASSYITGQTLYVDGGWSRKGF